MGVVINDSIVLIDYINKHGKRDEDILTTLVESGRDRFRPVAHFYYNGCRFLPLLLETSFQAQVLIPMATSLCFGLILGTVLILYLVPTFYVLYYKLIKMLPDNSHGCCGSFYLRKRKDGYRTGRPLASADRRFGAIL